MLPMDDPRWKTMCGGYKMPYDARTALRALQNGKDQEPIWSEFWNELHHQGDLGEASYTVVPYLVEMQKASGALDWNFYALVAVIEFERHRKTNPPVPDWLTDGYKRAWAELEQVALHDFAGAGDPITQRVILSVLALSKGLIGFGAILSTFDESELLDILDTHMAWSELYRH